MLGIPLGTSLRLEVGTDDTVGESEGQPLPNIDTVCFYIIKSGRYLTAFFNRRLMVSETEIFRDKEFRENSN